MRKLIINKKGFEFSFAWIFAIIVGAVILFIALFAATRLVDTSQTEAEAKISEQIGIILNPVETNLEEAKYAVIGFGDETQVHNRCRETGPFGKQIISVSVESGFGDDFEDPEVDNFFFNKYLFSNSVEQGKNIYLIVKPFEMPYKVADLIFASSDNYCFVNPPRDVEDDILDLNPEHIKSVAEKGECGREVVVCFDDFDSSCDIQVDTSTKSVRKNEEILYYEDSLLYGAIFSDPGIYECQTKRLMKRAGELAHLYADKTEFLSTRGCSSSLGPELRSFASDIQIENSAELPNKVIFKAEEIGRKNELLSCKLF